MLLLSLCWLMSYVMVSLTGPSFRSLKRRLREQFGSHFEMPTSILAFAHLDTCALFA